MVGQKRNDKAIYENRPKQLRITWHCTACPLTRLWVSSMTLSGSLLEAPQSVTEPGPGPPCSEASGPSEAAKNATKGECLTWKALSYFFLVRSFGEVPIIHSTSEEIEKKEYNQVHKVKKADVYEYIIMTLEEAMKLLPKSASDGRLDYYSAEGLLAKVYLTKAGVSGTLNQSDLDKAAMYAKDVIDNSGRKLEDNYEDIFKLANSKTKEGLIVWRWVAS